MNVWEARTQHCDKDCGVGPAMAGGDQGRSFPQLSCVVRGPARWEQGSTSHIHYITNCSQRRSFGQEFRPSRKRLYFVLMMHFLSSMATLL